MNSPGGGAPLTIAFAGLFGSPNLGNEATLSAFLANVTRRLPGARFVCIAPRQSDIERQQRIPLVPIDPLPVAQYLWRMRPQALRHRMEHSAQRLTEPLRARRARQQLERVDVLVLPGTGLFDDFGQGPLDLPSHLDRWTREARRVGARADYVSVGVSTVHSEESRKLFAATLQRATYCSFRDERSSEHARALGMDDRQARVYPDLAFSLPPDVLPPPKPSNPPTVIGVGLMGYYGWNLGLVEGEAFHEEYLDRVARLIAQLVNRGLQVQLLIGDARADDGVSGKVLQRCEQLGVAAGAVRPAGLPDFRGVLAQIGSVDAVIATRFHNVLFSLLLGKPVISLSYADKNDALMKSFELEAYCHDVGNFDSSEVIAQLGELMAHHDVQVVALHEKVAAARHALDRQYDDLCDQWSSLVS